MSQNPTKPDARYELSKEGLQQVAIFIEEIPHKHAKQLAQILAQHLKQVGAEGAIVEPVPAPAEAAAQA